VRSPDFVDSTFRAGQSGNGGACFGAAACTLRTASMTTKLTRPRSSSTGLKCPSQVDRLTRSLADFARLVSQVRRRLPAGGNRIRTAGPTSESAQPRRRPDFADPQPGNTTLIPPRARARAPCRTNDLSWQREQDSNHRSRGKRNVRFRCAPQWARRLYQLGAPSAQIGHPLPSQS
jgi:hypothetical protein